MALGFRKQRGGDMVKFGFYWNVAEWEAQIVPAEGGQLKGDASTRYVRLPLLALLIVAPLMGAAYAMFLPFIGFAMVLMYLLGRLRPTETVTNPPAADASGDASVASHVGGDAKRSDHERKRAA
jgi:hypothetical protein